MSLSLPPEGPNSRFFHDELAAFRPALSLRGFDNRGDDRHGYGLAQVLERAATPASRQARQIARLSDLAGQSYQPWRRGAMDVADHNSAVLEAASFMALASLVLEHNQMNLPGLGAHRSSLEKLLTGLKSIPLTLPLFASEVFLPSDFDRVHWTLSVGHAARALDCYLALEIAYAFYGEDQRALLSEGEKAFLLGRMFGAVEAIRAVVDSGIGIGKSISGNWSLKQWAAAAYASLGTQARHEQDGEALTRWFERGVHRAGPGSTRERTQYWTFMTSRGGRDGRRFWGEGPYYLDFTFSDVLPLWHAVRAQGRLGELPDPFRSEWFTAPLDWMADISTPEGGVPPFDDGNRGPIQHVDLMAWAPTYGDGALGEKMAWIRERMATMDPESRDWVARRLPLAQLAVPSADAPAHDPLPGVVGNDGAGVTEEEQLIVRKPLASGMHYVCLHGEGSKEAVERGEGHEQPDQLQLLYYVDRRSVLMDAGYDRGHLLKSSSWNRYTWHNVMAYTEGDGGVPAPISTPVPVRGVVRKFASHAPVELLTLVGAPSGHLTAMRGELVLEKRECRKILFFKVCRTRARSRYTRTVLFVADPNAPYLIDVNQAKTIRHKDAFPEYRMRYHVDSADLDLSGDWMRWRLDDRQNLYLFLQPVEFDRVPEDLAVETVQVEERYRETKSIARLSLHSHGEKAFTSVALFQLAAEAPAHTPVPLITSAPGGSRDHQVWLWETHAGRCIDAIFVRSGGDSDSDETPRPLRLALADGVAMQAEAVGPVAFCRLRWANGVWNADPSFTHGMTVETRPEGPPIA